jgi:hypothetical protein
MQIKLVQLHEEAKMNRAIALNVTLFVIVETMQYKPGSFKEEVCLSRKKGLQS